VTPETERLRKEAKAYLPVRLKELAEAGGFSYNSVRIKNNVSNWGSCSSKGNINLNLNLMRLPKELQDYVMLHELCHLRYMNHGPEFHAMLEKLCPNHRELRKKLREYRLT
jgi:predicted metal-dependent hydrolase